LAQGEAGPKRGPYLLAFFPPMFPTLGERTASLRTYSGQAMPVADESEDLEGQMLARHLPKWTVVRLALLALGVFLALTCVALVGLDGISMRLQAQFLGGEVQQKYPDVVVPGEDEAVLTCPRDGSVCICGLDPIYSWTMKAVCRGWRFQVGDTLFFARPACTPPMTMPWLIDMYTWSKYIHTAIVVKVPPAGEAQTRDNVMLSAAVHAEPAVHTHAIGEIFRKYPNAFPWGGVKILRVDPARFPQVQLRQAEIWQWVQDREGENYDPSLFLPGRRNLPPYFQTKPDCDERKRALRMFEAGGPHVWACSQYVAWTLAFPAGLNTGSDPSGNCPIAPWVFDNLQPFPDEVIDEPIWEHGTEFNLRCSVHGCFMPGDVPALPVTASPTVNPYH